MQYVILNAADKSDQFQNSGFISIYCVICNRLKLVIENINVLWTRSNCINENFGFYPWKDMSEFWNIIWIFDTEIYFLINIFDVYIYKILKREKVN